MCFLLLNKRANAWEKYVSKTLYTLRNRKSRVTGETPARLLYGHSLAVPGQWDIPQFREQQRQPTRITRRVVRERQLNFRHEYVDPNNHPALEFQAGSQVLARTFRKSGKPFAVAWTGPHQVTRRITAEIYEIDRDGNLQKIHLDDIRPAPQGNQDAEISSELDTSDDHVSTASSHSANSSDEEPDDPPQPEQLIVEAEVHADASSSAPPPTESRRAVHSPGRGGPPPSPAAELADQFPAAVVGKPVNTDSLVLQDSASPSRPPGVPSSGPTSETSRPSGVPSSGPTSSLAAAPSLEQIHGVTQHSDRPQEVDPSAPPIVPVRRKRRCRLINDRTSPGSPNRISEDPASHASTL